MSRQSLDVTAPPSRENVRVLRMAGIAQMPFIAWLASTDLGGAYKARILPPTLCDIVAGRFVIAVRGVQFTNGLGATISRRITLGSTRRTNG